MSTRHSIVIIEHPTKGVLRPDSSPATGEWHWSWSGARSDSSKSWLFENVDYAIRVFERMPTRDRAVANVRVYDPVVKRSNQLADSYRVVYPASRYEQP